MQDKYIIDKLKEWDDDTMNLLSVYLYGLTSHEAEMFCPLVKLFL
jgi:hypothetical protein